MNCIICKFKLEKYSENSYLNMPVYVCKNCNSFVTGQEENEIKKKLKELYSGEYWEKLEVEKSIKSNFTDTASQGKYRNWLSQYLYSKPFFNSKKNILEIGVGGGQASVWFEKEGFRITGIEPDKRNVDLINQKLENGKILHSFIEEINLDEKFDIFWMSHVLEHLVRPDIFLEKIYNNLEDDGVFFIEVPSSEHTPTLKASIFENPHIHHFSKQSLIKLVEKHYRVVSCDCFRPATKIEGGIKKIFKNSKMFPFYPRIMTECKKGRDLRIILKKK